MKSKSGEIISGPDYVLAKNKKLLEDASGNYHAVEINIKFKKGAKGALGNLSDLSCGVNHKYVVFNESIDTISNTSNNHISGKMSDVGFTGKSTIGENTLWRFSEQGTDIHVIFNNKNEIISITANGKLAGTTPSHNLLNFCKKKGIKITKADLIGTPGSLDVKVTPRTLTPENPEVLTLGKQCKPYPPWNNFQR